jgi:hypothetical protein
MFVLRSESCAKTVNWKADILPQNKATIFKRRRVHN